MTSLPRSKIVFMKVPDGKLPGAGGEPCGRRLALPLSGQLGGGGAAGAGAAAEEGEAVGVAADAVSAGCTSEGRLHAPSSPYAASARGSIARLLVISCTPRSAGRDPRRPGARSRTRRGEPRRPQPG